MSRIQIKKQELIDTLQMIEIIQKNNDSFSDTIVIELNTECDTHTGRDIVTFYLKNNYVECDDFYIGTNKNY